MVLKIREIKSDEEKDFLALERVFSHLKLNSMMGGSFGGVVMGACFAGANSFGNKNHDAVYAIEFLSVGKHIYSTKDEHYRSTVED